MPQIPKELHRPCMEEVVIDLLKSIAMEETALSHILLAESEKTKAFVGKDHHFPNCHTQEEIIQFNHATHDILELILMKEWILYQKLKRVSSLQKHAIDCEVEEE
ncbi:hypothetical protein [Tumebacillus algifaecis]|nr:hypothetical protein [Tumebacillus algifaecis]